MIVTIIQNKTNYCKYIYIDLTSLDILFLNILNNSKRDDQIVNREIRKCTTIIRFMQKVKTDAIPKVKLCVAQQFYDCYAIFMQPWYGDDTVLDSSTQVSFSLMQQPTLLFAFKKVYCAFLRDIYNHLHHLCIHVLLVA